jgi:pimeloyl-ACP methyl ester carboxylesterase
MARRRIVSLWVASVVFTIALVSPGVTTSLPGGDADGLRVTDYFLSHTSNEPFYRQQKLDSRVILHMREVVLSGRERTVSADGWELLLIHGGTFPGYVAFDTKYANVSQMRHFARSGWDTFALDLEGYCLSTRPMIMDAPTAFPESKAPMHGEFTVRNIERAVDFIRTLRGVEKVHLLGWSLGADLEVPRYAIQKPGKVASLVFYGVGYDGPMSMDRRRERAVLDEAAKVLYSRPCSSSRRAGLGTKKEFIVPGAFEAFRTAHLASDPKSAELGGAVRWPAGRSVDLDLSKAFFDASKIRVPTLVIGGEADTWATCESNRLLVESLGREIEE